MKTFKYLSIKLQMFCLMSLTFACSKNADKILPTASLTVINALPGSNAIVTNFSNNYQLASYYQFATQLNYNSFSAATNEFGSYSGTTPIMLYQIPDTFEKSKPLFQLSLNLSGGSIHTLFLTGTLTSPDTLFTTDHPPYHPVSDSTMGIRFVNLSPGSNPVNVDIQGNNGKEASNISYKGMTDFKNYPADSTVNGYTFEFRDAATDSLLASYNLSGINNGSGNSYVFRNFTIAFLGIPGATDATAQTTLLINNY